MHFPQENRSRFKTSQDASTGVHTLSVAHYLYYNKQRRVPMDLSFVEVCKVTLLREMKSRTALSAVGVYTTRCGGPLIAVSFLWVQGRSCLHAECVPMADSTTMRRNFHDANLNTIFSLIGNFAGTLSNRYPKCVVYPWYIHALLLLFFVKILEN